MQVGLVLPQGYFNEFEGWQPGRAWARIVELAQTAERLGFESIWTGEHVLSKWPGESIALLESVDIRRLELERLPIGSTISFARLDGPLS